MVKKEEDQTIGSAMGIESNSHCEIFLNGFGDTHSFQTFDDKGINRSLIRQFHGTFREHKDSLADLNRKGAGIFFTVNQTDLRGRTTQNVHKVRAVFIDLDGSPLPKEFELEPQFILETSPKKYHCYWLVSDMPLKTFPLYQIALAEKFDSDPKVKDLPRVMRVAGFNHYKKEPFPIKLIQVSMMDAYKMEEIKNAFDLKRPMIRHTQTNYTPSMYKGKYTGTLRYGMSEGDRHSALVKMLIAIRMRGETFEYAKNEAIQFARGCNPPENENEVLFQLSDIWKRYGTTGLPS